jgi:CubicO group peptidase (beta-lactamase class C family)
MTGFTRNASGYGPYRYCTANAFLAGQIVQRATHTPIDRYMEKKLLQPLGITRQTWSYSPSHETMTGGGLELRSRDWAKVAWMLTDNGRWNGKQIVPQSWLAEMFTIRRASRADQNYGYFAFEGTYQTSCGRQPVWYAAGNGGSQILMLPTLHAAVVVTREAYNVHGTSYQTAEMLEKYVLPALPCDPSRRSANGP